MLEPALFALAMVVSVALGVLAVIADRGRRNPILLLLCAVLLPVISWPLLIQLIREERTERALQAGADAFKARREAAQADREFWADRLANGTPTEKLIAEQLLAEPGNDPTAKPVREEDRWPLECSPAELVQALIRVDGQMHDRQHDVQWLSTARRWALGLAQLEDGPVLDLANDVRRTAEHYLVKHGHSDTLEPEPEPDWRWQRLMDHILREAVAAPLPPDQERPNRKDLP